MPESGFAVGMAPPRLSTPYWGWRDRIGLLVETHSWKPYPQRVGATFDALVAILERAREDAAGWSAAVRSADAGRRGIGGKDVALAFGPGDDRTTIEFRGYAYRREPSKVSGAERIVYDESTPKTWSVPLVTTTKPTIVTRVPRAGYVVLPAHAPLYREKLALHGFRTVPVPAERKDISAEVYRATQAKFDAAPYEGRHRVTVQGAWTRQTLDVPAGSLFVPIAQAGALLLCHLLEPEAPDSIVAWGYVNAVFEQKEYMESYVAEELALEMLRDDPRLRARFEEALARDPVLASAPAKRLDFFYRLSPYWDVRKDVVPVLRVDAF
jgi:hypothetical protein